MLIPFGLLILKNDAYSKALYIVYAIFIIMSFNGNFPQINEGFSFFEVRKEKSFEVSEVVVSPDNEFPPLKVLLPVGDDRCGNSEIPCVPRNETVRQRIPSDISAGFLPIER